MKKLFILTAILISVIGCQKKYGCRPLFDDDNTYNGVLDSKAQVKSFKYAKHVKPRHPETGGLNSIIEYKNNIGTDTLLLYKDVSSSDRKSYKGEWYLISLYESYAEIIIDENISTDSRGIYVILSYAGHHDDLRVTQSGAQ